jgi:membrane-associated protease RseP (regulator of RpoE activity)
LSRSHETAKVTPQMPQDEPLASPASASVESSIADDDADGPPGSDAPEPFRWKLNLVLFVATVASVFLTGARYVDEGPGPAGWRDTLRSLPSGWSFAVPLLAILLTHEFGHYIAARIHKVDASLPFFIPLPRFSPFGTMGAIISMRGRIRSRDALLDIGASGPLAGLVVALPVLIVGLAHSHVGPAVLHGTQEGQSLLYIALKRIVLGPIPDGQDVFLGPMAFAGWTGLFITALNLIPIGQLDGGHIAYALFGLRQNRFARVLHASLLGMFGLNLVRFMIPIARAHAWSQSGQAFGNALPWLVWYGLLHLIMRGGGRDHPPTEPGELSPVRKAIALFSLVLFVLLFMPTPMAQY